jgi:hypothetical protein
MAGNLKTHTSYVNEITITQEEVKWLAISVALILPSVEF